MSKFTILGLVAELQEETGHWLEVQLSSAGDHLRLSNRNFQHKCTVAANERTKMAKITMSSEGCRDMVAAEPRHSPYEINRCINAMFNEVNSPVDASAFKLSSIQAVEIDNFICGGGSMRNAPLFMSDALVQAMIHFMSKEVLAEYLYKLTRGDFDGIREFEDAELNHAFFMMQRKHIKKWMQRTSKAFGGKNNNFGLATKEQIPSILHQFSISDIKEVVADDNKRNPRYKEITDAITKAVAMHIAQCYKNFSHYWIPF